METEYDDSQEVQLMEKLILHINGKEFNAEFPDKDGSKIIINGKPFEVELLKTYSQNIFSFAVNNRILQVAWDYREFDSNYLIADGFTHEVEVTDETKQLLKQFLLNSSDSSDANHAKVKAPMPGMVVKILVNEGEVVAKGDKIIIIEAMKMENAISAPLSGTIKNIKAVEGKAVDKDSLILEIFA